MSPEPPGLREAIDASTSRFELWTSLVQASRATHVVEVGVWKGRFAKHILERCPDIERYYMVDPWAQLPDWNKPFNVAQERFDDVLDEAMASTAFASEKITVLRGRTKEVIDEIPDGSIDFAYIDGDHTLRGIVIDLVKVLPKIKPGGLLGGDDFTTNHWVHGPDFEPSLVCPSAVYFAEAVDLPIFGLPFDQFLIQKQDAPFEFVDTVGRYGDLSMSATPAAETPTVAAKAKRALVRFRRTP